MWQSLNPATAPLDCWPVGEGQGHWYGGGESLKSKWPLDHGHIRMSPFVTGSVVDPNTLNLDPDPKLQYIINLKRNYFKNNL